MRERYRATPASMQQHVYTAARYSADIEVNTLRPQVVRACTRDAAPATPTYEFARPRQAAPFLAAGPPRQFEALTACVSPFLPRVLPACRLAESTARRVRRHAPKRRRRCRRRKSDNSAAMRQSSSSGGEASPAAAEVPARPAG